MWIVFWVTVAAVFVAGCVFWRGEARAERSKGEADAASRGDR